MGHLFIVRPGRMVVEENVRLGHHMPRHLGPILHSAGRPGTVAIVEEMEH